MALGFDGSGVSYGTRERVRARDAEVKPEAPLVTGPNKIFNDAARAVEKLSRDIESYSPLEFFSPSRRGWFSSLVSKAREWLQPKPEIVGNGWITKDIAALETLAKELPPPYAENCRFLIGEAQKHIKLEDKVHAMQTAVDATRSRYFWDVGLALQKMDFGLTSMFTLAGERHKFHSSCDSVRDRLFERALAP